jgi:hypothetical protein
MGTHSPRIFFSPRVEMFESATSASLPSRTSSRARALIRCRFTMEPAAAVVQPPRCLRKGQCAAASLRAPRWGPPLGRRLRPQRGTSISPTMGSNPPPPPLPLLLPLLLPLQQQQQQQPPQVLSEAAAAARGLTAAPMPAVLLGVGRVLPQQLRPQRAPRRLPSPLRFCLPVGAAAAAAVGVVTVLASAPTVAART